MWGTKKFKCNPVLNHELYPPPVDLKKSLDLISKDFNNSRVRNMDIFDEEGRLFGFITSYSGSNFCWIQPTKTRSKVSGVEYYHYLKTINKRREKESPEGSSYFWASSPKIGEHVVAQYEADRSWYRAIVVGEPVAERWLILFIDYGNFQRSYLSQMNKPIVEPGCDHFSVPLQAVCCRLYNIVPKLPENRELIDANLEGFYAKHCAHYLELVVRNVRPDYIVDCDVFLSRPHGPQNLWKHHIGQEVVDNGLATFADPERAYANKPPPAETIKIDDDDDEDEDEDEDEDMTAATTEPTIEPKVESKVEPKVEPKFEFKVEPKFEPKVEPKFEPKVEPKHESKPLYKYQTINYF